MFFVDKPYVSDFFKMTVRDNAIPVVGTDIAKELGLYQGTIILSEADAVKMAQEEDNLSLYTTSENSIGWIAKHLSFSDFLEKIDLFKNKNKFRELTKSMFPDFYFKEVKVEDLSNLQFSELPLPLIIKPATGFMSMGVHKVANSEEWSRTINLIVEEIDQKKDIYPAEVVDTSLFIIEQCVKGEEFETVISYGLLHGYVPHWNEIFSGNATDASKKLLYVICSRAKTNLHLISETGRQTRRGDPLAITPELQSNIFEYDEC